MRGATRTIVLHYSGAVLFTALAVLVRFLLDPMMGDSRPLATLYGAVVLVAWLGGYRPAILDMVLGCIACNFVCIEPRGKFLLLDSRRFAGVFLYLLSSA